MQELHRRMASAKSWGIEPVSLITPAEIKELVPFIDESILSAASTRRASASSTRCAPARIMREKAHRGRRADRRRQHRGARHRRRARPRPARAHDRAATSRPSVVIIACGVWSPRIARMAGASIPLTPAVHQMIDIGPVPRFATPSGMIEFPIVRDMDTNMYERQDGGGLEIGSYAHRPILHDPDEIPSIEESALSPTELPFTQADFELQMEHALELMPEIVGDESRRREVRDQRPALADPRRAADPGRDAGGQGPVVGRRGLGQGGAGRRQVGRRVDGARRVGDRPPRLRHRPLPRAPEDPRARPRPRGGGLQQDVRDRPSGRAVGVRTATSGCRRSTPASASSAPSSTRPPAGSARTGTSPTRRCSRSTASASPAARRSGTRAGGRRSSTPSTSPCATARRWSTSQRLPHLRHRRRRALEAPSSAWRCARWTCRSAGSSTRRCCRRAAASGPT